MVEGKYVYFKVYWIADRNGSGYKKDHQDFYEGTNYPVSKNGYTWDGPGTGNGFYVPETIQLTLQFWPMDGWTDSAV